MKNCLAKDPDERLANRARRETPTQVDSGERVVRPYCRVVRRADAKIPGPGGLAGRRIGVTALARCRFRLVASRPRVAAGNVLQQLGPIFCRIRCSIAGRTFSRSGRVFRSGKQKRDLDPAGGRPRRCSAAGNRGRILSLLVTQWTLHRILRRGQAQDRSMLPPADQPRFWPTPLLAAEVPGITTA